MDNHCRSCWQNCGLEADAEMLEIDEREDAMAPLDEQTTQIRTLITRYEACYHEADKEAERIVGAIGTGQCPAKSDERPPERKRDLENCRRILSRWAEEPGLRCIDLDVGGIGADGLLNSIGPATPLKIWQVRASLTGSPLRWIPIGPITIWLLGSMAMASRPRIPPANITKTILHFSNRPREPSSMTRSRAKKPGFLWRWPSICCFPVTGILLDLLLLFSEPLVATSTPSDLIHAVRAISS